MSLATTIHVSSTAVFIQSLYCINIRRFTKSVSDKSSDDGTHSTRDVSESLDEEPKTSLKHARDTDLEITDNDPAKLKNIFKRLKDKDGKAKAVAIVNLPSSNGTGGGAIVDKVAPRGRQNNSVNGAEADVGVKFRDTKVGLGPMVVLGSTVVLRFIGKVAASGKLYDRNVDGKPVTILFSLHGLQRPNHLSISCLLLLVVEKSQVRHRICPLNMAPTNFLDAQVSIKELSECKPEENGLSKYPHSWGLAINHTRSCLPILTFS